MLVEAPDSGERRFAQLNVDAIQQITALLPTASLLALTAVSQELGRTFCPAVARLAVSKVPEPFSPLSPSHTSLSHPLSSLPPHLSLQHRSRCARPHCGRLLKASLAATRC